MKTCNKWLVGGTLACLLAAPVLAQSGRAGNNPSQSAGITMSLTIGADTTPVLAWSWGASHSGSAQSGGGGGAGKANFQDMSFTRYSDALSPSFVTALAAGTHLPSVTFKRGLLVLELEDVLISSYSTGGNEVQRTDAQTENISLNFARIRYTVGGATFCYDIASNTSCQ